MNEPGFPLFQRFPALRRIPRVQLCDLPSPVLHTHVDGRDLWIKRDDLNAPICAGNKARTLEFLLAGVQPGDTVLTLGGEGSTHVLATALHARRIGARTIGVRWLHEMNDTALRTADLIDDECVMAPVSGTALGAVARAQWTRITQSTRYVPLGGSTPLGVLAQVNAGLEMAEQVREGLLPQPARVVLPLGSGGTAAGIALGLAIAGMNSAVVAVQVTPALVANALRVRRLAGRAARLIERVSGERVPRLDSSRLHVARGGYGGAYGRPVAAAITAARKLEDATGIRLDHTYSAKAFAIALQLARSDSDPVLFWNTFDSRLLTL